MQPKTRRRGADLEQAILDAAWAELAASGWSGFTIAAVAARCGTAKAVLYRRWDNRVELAQDMLVRALGRDDRTAPSSGDLRTDLLDFLRGMQAFLDGPFGAAVRGVVTERADRSSSLVDAVVPTPLAGAVDAALTRGELTVRPSSFVQNLGHAVMISELVHTHAPLRGAAIEELVDAVWLPALRLPTLSQDGPDRSPA